MTSMCSCLLGGNLVSRQVWSGKGVRGILLDTETAECHGRTDVLGEKTRKEKKEKETSLINAPFCQRKATHLCLVKITN